MVSGIFIPILEVALLIVVAVSEKCIEVNGHAGYAEHGKDIVCAGVSVLTQNLINSIKAFTDDVISYEVAPAQIHINYENLSEQSKLLIDSFFIGVCEIQRAYPKYVQII